MIQLGLVGVGRWGRNILRALETIRGVRVTHVCSTRRQELMPLRDRYHTTGDWRALLAVALDGVVIATPAAAHARVALPFIQRGMATFIEKPMTTSVRDAQRLQRAAQRSGAVVFVGHVHLYNPAYQAAKALAHRGGPLRYLLFESMNNGPYRDDVSALWDWAPHDVAMAVDLVGQHPRWVQAWGILALRPRERLYDAAAVRLRFAGGVEAVAIMSWLMPTKRKALTIVGAKDTIVCDDTAPRKVTLYKGIGPRVRGARVIRKEPTVSHPPYSQRAPLDSELRAFLATIRGRRPRPDLRGEIAVVQIIAVAERSIRLAGRAISLV